MCVCGVITLNTTGKKKEKKKVFVAESSREQRAKDSQWVYLDVCICALFCVYGVCVHVCLLVVVSAVLH